MSISSQKLLRNTSETFDDLKDSAVVSETENEEVITERSMTSMSNECLPDPSNIDIPDTHSGKYLLLSFIYICRSPYTKSVIIYKDCRHFSHYI